MIAIPLELEKQILAAPGTRIGLPVAAWFDAHEPPATFADEKQFLAAVIAVAKRLGWRAYHTHDSRKSAAGFPDLTLWRERLLFAELKTDAGQLSAAQLNVIEGLREAGAEVYVWRPSDWAEVLLVLARPERQMTPLPEPG